jgi:hypothetical protein
MGAALLIVVVSVLINELADVKEDGEANGFVAEEGFEVVIDGFAGGLEAVDDDLQLMDWKLWMDWKLLQVDWKLWMDLTLMDWKLWMDLQLMDWKLWMDGCCRWIGSCGWICS